MIITNKEFNQLQTLISIRDSAMRVLADLEFLHKITEGVMDKYSKDLKDAIQWICDINMDASKQLRSLLAQDEFYNKLP